MKNLYKLFAIMLLGLTGCQDFLEEQNKSSATAEAFYLTNEGFESLVNANYSALREIYGQDPWLFVAGTDLYSEGRNPEPTGLSRYTALTPASDGVDFLYNTCFTAIQRANTALYYADITEETSTISQRVGEIRYLRANAYFLLVQTYGGVSIITKLIEDAVTEFDRDTAEDVYAFIISELEEALELVSDEPYMGRVNQRAVQHLLAKVHLTRAYESYAASNDFATAASYADEAIAGQMLNLTFEELWTPGSELNEETIFSVQFSTGSISTAPADLGHQQQNWFGSYLGGVEVAGDAPYKSYNLLPNRFLLDLFIQGDTRWDATFMTEVYERYYDYFEVADKSSLAVAHFYAPQWFTTVDSTAYVTANPSAVYHGYGSYDPDGGDVSLDYATIIVKKFDDPNSVFAGDGTERRVSSRDFIIARLAETYLIAAEAYLGAGNPGTALDRLNEVRRRAGVPDATSAEFDIDYILNERARELLGEYHRWFDLKRTGKLVERASAYNRLISADNFAGNNGELKLLRPIPQLALDLNQNKEFVQNPAYN